MPQIRPITDLRNTNEISAEFEQDRQLHDAREALASFKASPKQPNKETIAAMLEAERIAHDPGVKHYSDVEEALRELKR